MNDLIYRQDAIEAAKDLLKYHGQDLTEELINYFSANAMERIPAAQQEVIRCKDCTAYGEMIHGKDERMICHKFALNFPEDFYCAEAERRTDE